MPRRYYAKSKKTYAKNQSFEQDQVGEEKERYLVSIELMSLKTTKDYDIFGWRGEFYFKVEGDKVFKARWPNKGEIKLQRNQEFTSKADMSLWSQFITVRADESIILPIEVYLRERPQKTEYVILQDDDEDTKAKLRIQSSRTRY
ncbi:MAG: hypothetical protein P8Y23_03560 [Candidatus Lokiarchaeota archaeon]